MITKNNKILSENDIAFNEIESLLQMFLFNVQLYIKQETNKKLACHVYKFDRYKYELHCKRLRTVSRG